MPLNCPHCSADVSATLTTKAEVASTLAAKEQEIARLRTEAAKGALVDDLTRQKAEAEARAAAASTGLDRFKAMAAASPKLLDAKVAAAVEAVYALEEGAKPEAERKPFATWLGADAKTHPALAHLFTAPPAANPPAAPAAAPPGPAAPPSPPAQPGQPGAPAAPPAQPAASNLPPSSVGAQPPAPPQQGKITREQLRAIFNSPEYRALTKEQQDAKIRELEAQAAKPQTVAV
jgi:hypothetical protein